MPVFLRRREVFLRLLTQRGILEVEDSDDLAGVDNGVLA
jgi:hypothetical protein